MAPTMRCDDCGRSHNAPGVRAGPMLRDAVWVKLAKKHEWLCGDRVLKRAADRGIILTFDDLLPCEFNLFGSPSWFERLGGDLDNVRNDTVRPLRWRRQRT